MEDKQITVTINIPPGVSCYAVETLRSKDPTISKADAYKMMLAGFLGGWVVIEARENP